MHAGKLVFAQLMAHLPLHTFRQCVANYPSRYPTLTFSHLDPLVSALLIEEIQLVIDWQRVHLCLRIFK